MSSQRTTRCTCYGMGFPFLPTIVRTGDRESYGQCRNLFRLRADADRKLDGCINHEHPATADNGCFVAGPWSWREHCQTEGLSHPGAVAPRPRGGSAERHQHWRGWRPRSPHSLVSSGVWHGSGPGWRWRPAPPWRWIGCASYAKTAPASAQGLCSTACPHWSLSLHARRAWGLLRALSSGGLGVSSSGWW